MSEDRHSPPAKEAIDRGHEHDAVNSRLMVFSGLGIAALMGLSVWLAFFLMDLSDRETEKRTEARRRVPPVEDGRGVRFTADQPRQLEELRQVEKLRLHHYEWIDQPEGIARIPIDRAIDILANDGLPENKLPPEEENDNPNEE